MNCYIRLFFVLFVVIVLFIYFFSCKCLVCLVIWFFLVDGFYVNIIGIFI